jgi:hypothetical protein
MRAVFSIFICFMLLFSTVVNRFLANEWFEKFGIEVVDTTILEEETKHFVPNNKKSKFTLLPIVKAKNYFSSPYIPKQKLHISKIFNPPEILA